MSVVTDTTNHESGSRAIRESPLREVGWGIVSVFMPLAAVYENWIPAYAGMTGGTGVGGIALRQAQGERAFS